MKVRGKIILAAGAVLVLLAGTAILLHRPHARPLLEQLHGQVHGTAPAVQGDAGAEAATRARDGAAAMGRRWDADVFAETVSLYTEVHRGLGWPGLLEPEAFRYGPGEQQTLTLFRPEQGFSEPGPVFVFVHGNGLGAPDWRLPGSEGLLLTHAGRLAATAGGLGVLMNYRTGEAESESSGAEDLRLVVEWLKRSIARYGGDPETIVVVAHSEGASHAAAYLFDEGAQPESGPGIAAAVLSSGSFGDGAQHLADLIDAYGGERVPLALWSAEFDPLDVETGMARLHRQLCDKLDGCPGHEQMQGYNHMSQLFSLGTADATVMNAFIRFYHTVR
jgi:acetyl esterase/lipase